MFECAWEGHRASKVGGPRSGQAGRALHVSGRWECMEGRPPAPPSPTAQHARRPTYKYTTLQAACIQAVCETRSGLCSSSLPSPAPPHLARTPANSLRACPAASSATPIRSATASCLARMSAMRYSGLHSHCRSRRRPAGVTQLSTAARSVPASPPSPFSSTCGGEGEGGGAHVAH